MCVLLLFSLGAFAKSCIITHLAELPFAVVLTFLHFSKLSMKCIEDLKNKTTPPPQGEQCACSKCCIFSLKSCSAIEISVNLIPPGSGTGHRVVPRSKHWQCNSHCAGPAHPL